ncbi:MAG TPA: type IV toxin-antitoxin system AbiEi family antitoxin domain-containing protein [Propionicimonas sp.]|uniref:type IV toxin-antitoxin system AbiEi family antitoxin domain-containing protein n=1 Tax=Propionicimonas sp. TaxID=1955623 RepID=UPI002F40A0DA
MRKRQEIPDALRQLIGAQHGLVTAQQAATFGVGDDALCRLVDQGHWRRSTRGLYDAVPLLDSFRKQAWAALLLGGPEAAIGGEAALCLHGLQREVRVIDVWVPPDAQPQPLAGIRVRRDFLGRISRRRGHIARIAVEEALIDVGQLLPTSSLVALLTDAFRLRVTTPLAVAAVLHARRRVRGRRQFEALLGDLLGVESGLEYAYRRDVERAHGLPTARRQVSLSRGTRSDAVYEEHGVIVELDGVASHATAAAAFRDLRRDNIHAEVNVITLRYGSADVRGRPCDVAAQVAAVLRSRGWTGQQAACPRCRRQAVS